MPAKGVGTFGFKAAKSPPVAAAGLDRVSGSSSRPKVSKDFTKGRSNHNPKSVKVGDGTAPMRGTKVVHKGPVNTSGPSTSKRSVAPSAVRVADGLSVPKRVKR